MDYNRKRSIPQTAEALRAERPAREKRLIGNVFRVWYVFRVGPMCDDVVSAVNLIQDLL